jgi:plasmid stability protein
VAQLIVRNVDDSVVRALKQRAVQHGRSAEAEHRALLREALMGAPRKGLKALLREMPEVGRDADFAPHRGPGRRVKL